MRSLLNRYSQSPAVRDSHGNSSQPNKTDLRILHESWFARYQDAQVSYVVWVTQQTGAEAVSESSDILM
jgi:hypothetical protein